MSSSLLSLEKSSLLDTKNHLLTSPSLINTTQNLLLRPNTNVNLVQNLNASALKENYGHLKFPPSTFDNNVSEKRKISLPENKYVKRHIPSTITTRSALSLENTLLSTGSYQKSSFTDIVPPPLEKTTRSSLDVTDNSDINNEYSLCKITPPQPSENKLPVYNFWSTSVERPKEEIYIPVDKDPTFLLKSKLQQFESLKVKFLTIVSTSLIHSPKYNNLLDPSRNDLLKAAGTIISFDPEFVLKVALYTRQELNIRSTANFLLAFASYVEQCRPFLKKYFASSIVLPSDWINVAELYQTFDDSKLNFGSLPAALRRAMKEAFPKFNEYQLAKYNRDKSKSKKKKPKEKEREKKTKPELPPDVLRIGDSSDDEDSEKEEEISVDEDSEKEEERERRTFSLKQLVRLLHIVQPAQHVMCLLGKKYPSDNEAFRKSKLPGIWDSTKADERMKLQVPETWETQISAGGNKAHVWEKLIDDRKLPYMATLRNLRNLLLAGISPKHHNKVINYISKEKAVINSRQFPLRFFSAYQAISELEALKTKDENYDAPTSSFKRNIEIPNWKKLRKAKMMQKRKNFELDLLKKYKAAVDKAVEIATQHNLNPISGTTLVLCDVSSSDLEKCSALKDVPGDLNKLHHGGLMLGFMCLNACENCELKVIYNSSYSETVTLDKKSILEKVEEISKKIDEKKAAEKVNKYYASNLKYMLIESVGYYLKPEILEKKQLDNIIFLTAGDSSEDSIEHKTMANLLRMYRYVANPRLLYVEVNLSGTKSESDEEEQKSEFLLHENNVFLNGFSDQLLRFVAEKGNGGQLLHVENIDKIYNLKSVPRYNLNQNIQNKNEDLCLLPVSLCRSPLPEWRTINVFISSTFKDMHGERNILIRYVFPELRARAHNLFLNIREVDLRWGITEAEACTQKSLELCLTEVLKCQLFVGILGDRYGWTPDEISSNNPDLDWVREHIPGASVTELEMHCGALSDPELARDKAFFFIRRNDFLNDVPNEWKSSFATENEKSLVRLEKLKHKIRNSGLEVYDTYPCEWGGVEDDQPYACQLEEFGQRVLDNLWNAICKLYHPDNTVLDKEREENTLHEDFAAKHNTIIGRNQILKACDDTFLKNKEGICLITGKHGCGKTAVLANLCKKFSHHPIFPYFIGMTPQSTELYHVLYCLTRSICQYFSLLHILPTSMNGLLDQFPQILKEAVESSLTGNIILVIDGLDHLCDFDSQKLEWIPFHMQLNGVMLFCSASENSQPYITLSERSQTQNSQISCLKIEPLDMSERQNLIRNHLQLYKKKLDESPFNNQMLALSTKEEAGWPLYLHFACEEIRTFGVFENLTKKLRNIPSRTQPLLEESLKKTAFIHGSVVETALCLLATAKEGLTERELHELLSISLQINIATSSVEDIIFNIENMRPENFIAPIKYRLLLHSLQKVLFYSEKQSESVMTIGHRDISAVITKCYMNSLKKKHISSIHKLLAAYFLRTSDCYNNQSWQGKSPRAFRSFMHHLMQIELHGYLANLLCNLAFISAGFILGIENYIMEFLIELKKISESSGEYALLNDKNDLNPKQIHDYLYFISHNMHILKQYPRIVMQEALSEPSSSCVYQDIINRPETGIMEWITKPNTMDLCFFTLSDFVQPILCTCASPHSNYAALGGEDGIIRLIDTESGKILKSFSGHSDAITSICFVGPNKVCSASRDKTLSMWDIEKGIRLFVSTGHTRNITCCSSDYTGQSFASSGMDCTVRIWSARDGREITRISDIKKPVNCMVFHPKKPEIIFGGWDGCLYIWDVIIMARNAVLKGHSSSIKSVAVTSDGLYLASSASNRELFIWSTTLKSRIYLISLHTLAVNSVCFSEGFVLTGNSDCTVKVMSDHRGTTLCEILSCTKSPVHLLKFLCYNLLVIAYQNGFVCLYDSGKDCFTLHEHESKDTVSCVSEYYDEFAKPQALLYGTISGKIQLLCFGSSPFIDNRREISIGEVSGPVIDVVFQRIGKREMFVAGTADGSVALFDNFQLNQPFLYTPHTGGISTFGKALKFQKLVTAGKSDKNVKLWLPKKNSDYSFEIKTCHADEITACQSSGDYLVTGSQDETVKLWNISSNDVKKVFVGRELQSSVSHVSLQDDCVYAGGRNGNVAMWTKKGFLFAFLPFHNNTREEHSPIAHIFEKVAENETRSYQALLAYIDKMGNIVITNPLQKSQITTLRGHTAPVLSTCIAKNGVVLSSSLDRSVRLSTLPKLDFKKPRIYHYGKVTSVIVNSKGDQVFSGDTTGCINMWKLLYNDQKYSLEYVCCIKVSEARVVGLCWIPSANGFVAAINEKGSAGYITFFKHFSDSKESKEKLIRNDKHKQSFTESITCIDYDAQKKNIVVGLNNGNIFITDLQSEKPKCNASLDSVALSICFSKCFESTYIFTCLDGSVNMNNVDPADMAVLFKEKEMILSPENKDSVSIAWPTALATFNGGFCVTDHCGRIYVNRDDNVQCLKIHSDSIICICIVGNLLFTSSKDSTIKVWNIQTMEQVGLFHFPLLLVTTMTAFDQEPSTGKCTTVFCGTSMGEVHLLLWKHPIV